MTRELIPHMCGCCGKPTGTWIPKDERSHEECQSCANFDHDLDEERDDDDGSCCVDWFFTAEVLDPFGNVVGHYDLESDGEGYAVLNVRAMNNYFSRSGHEEVHINQDEIECGSCGVISTVRHVNG